MKREIARNEITGKDADARSSATTGSSAAMAAESTIATQAPARAVGCGTIAPSGTRSILQASVSTRPTIASAPGPDFALGQIHESVRGVQPKDTEGVLPGPAPLATASAAAPRATATATAAAIADKAPVHIDTTAASAAAAAPGFALLAVAADRIEDGLQEGKVRRRPIGTMGTVYACGAVFAVGWGCAVGIPRFATCAARAWSSIAIAARGTAAKVDAVVIGI